MSLSAIRSCHRLDLLWVGLAAVGITLLSPFGDANIDPIGAGLALLAGSSLATYIVISSRISGLFQQGEGAAIAITVSALALFPLGWDTSHVLLATPELLWFVLGVAIFSTVVPLTLDFMMLKSTSAKTFGMLLSLEPAIAGLLGFVFFGEQLVPRALFGIALVMLASAGHSRLQRSC